MRGQSHKRQKNPSKTLAFGKRDEGQGRNFLKVDDELANLFNKIRGENDNGTKPESDTTVTNPILYIEMKPEISTL